MLGKQMCVCLLLSQIVSCFMVKNPSLQTYCSQLWTLPALSIHSPSRVIPVDHSFFQNTQATRHMSIYLAEFLYTYTIYVVMEISLGSHIHIQICFCLSVTRTCTMIHYLLIPPAAAGAIVRQQIYLNSTASKKIQVLQIRTIDVVQDPAVTEHFLFPGSYIL